LVNMAFTAVPDHGHLCDTRFPYVSPTELVIGNWSSEEGRMAEVLSAIAVQVVSALLVGVIVAAVRRLMGSPASA
jgi:hypothetical protein